MINKMKKIEATESELIQLNNKFHEKLIFSEAVYAQLMQAGCSYNKCLLVSAFPDSGHTYCGVLFRQDGAVIEFDIDLDDDRESLWKDITDDYLKIYEMNRNIQPWLKEVVTFNLFEKLKNNCSSDSEY